MKTLQLLILIVLLSISLLNAQTTSNVRTSTINGLTTFEAQTEAGKVKVNLPANIHAKDQISGTVEAEPTGKNERQTAKNAAYLEGVIVEIEGQQKSRKNSIVKFIAPAISAAAVAIIKDGKGRTIGQFELPVNPVPRIPTTNPRFDLPTIAQSGTPVVFSGPADGDLSNSIVNIDGKYFDPVAESPDGIIVVPTSDLGSGSLAVTVADNGAFTKDFLRLLDVNLSAGKLNLLRGETTSLKLSVSGLSGLEQPLQIFIQNHTPSYIRLSKGNQQIVEISPSQGTSDNFQYHDIIRSLRIGRFNISATLMPLQEDLEVNEDDPLWNDYQGLLDRANQLDEQANTYAQAGREDLAQALRDQARQYRERASSLEQDWPKWSTEESVPSSGAPQTRPTVPQVNRPGRSVPVPFPLQDNPKKPEEEVKEEEKCDCNAIDKNQVYSRGNNDRAQLLRQFRLSGGKGYQYQTAKIELQLSGNPGESCACENKKCEGEFELKLEMKILDLLNPNDQAPIPLPTRYALLDGVPVAKGTSSTNNNKPATNTSTTSERSNFPASRPENNFNQPNPRKRDYSATAKTKVPCAPGTYHRRFYIAPNPYPGGAKTPGVNAFNGPDLNAYVDVTIEIKEESTCKQKVSIKAYYLEYLPQYAWHPQAGAELPEVEYDIPGLQDRFGNPEPKGKTRNIAKLVEEDGKKVDDPFPPRQ